MHKKKGLLFAVIFIFVIAALICAYMLWEKAPAVNSERTLEPPAPAAVAEPSPTAEPETEITPEPTLEPTPEPTPTPIAEIAPQSARQDGVYTILLVGEDQISGNTDTILVGKLDTVNHKMDFVSIPRDTLLNMDGDMRKINCIYYKARARGADGARELVNKVTQLIGFEVDCYAKTDLDAFVRAIDAIGGVDCYVNQEVWMDDVWQNLFAYIPEGMQHLDGYHAMCLVRYRAGYADADLGRIDVQHDFLKALAKQMISLGNIPNLPKVLGILTENLDTNLSVSNIAYLIRQALLCKPEDINFYTVPVAGKTLGGGLSYAVIILYQWRDMINAYLNPFSEPITIDDLNVMYNDYFGIGCTKEPEGAWYYVGLAEAERAAAQQQY